MKRHGIVYLIAESPEARGVFDEKTEKKRKTFCVRKSLSMSEVYQAKASGFSPTLRLVLPQEFEYRGETLCEYQGERYRIIRDYCDEKTGDAVELTLERVRGNAAEPETETETEPSEGEGTGTVTEPGEGEGTGTETEPTETEQETNGAGTGDGEPALGG